MFNINNKDLDLQEIFQHIKEISVEKNKINEITSIENFKEEDIFEIVKTEEITKKINLDSQGVCDFCKKEIFFDENLSGLVIFNKFFVCEECCTNTTNNDLSYWAEMKNAKLTDIKPIALWQMEEKHKTRLI